jgi:hypothetical protein
VVTIWHKLGEIAGNGGAPQAGKQGGQFPASVFYDHVRLACMYMHVHVHDAGDYLSVSLKTDQLDDLGIGSLTLFVCLRNSRSSTKLELREPKVRKDLAGSEAINLPAVQTHNLEAP